MQQKRGIVKITAKEKKLIYDFLQGLITNDIYLLGMDDNGAESGEDVNQYKAIYSLMLTPNGRYMFDFFIVNYDENSVLIDICTEYIKDFIVKLNIYKLRSRIEIEDISGKLGTVIKYKDPRNTNMPDRVLSDDIIYDDEYDYLRIENRVVDGFADMVQEKSIPLEFRMDEQNAISFNKGCYMGQELISRTKHTGIVRKNIFKIQFLNKNQTKDISKGDDIFDQNDQKVGNLCSFNGDLGLAKIKIDAVESLPIDKFYIKEKENLIKVYH